MKKLVVLVLCLASLNMILVGCAHKGNISEKHAVQSVDATSAVMQEKDAQDTNETLTAVGGGGGHSDQEIADVSKQPTLLQKGVKESNGMFYEGENGSWHIYGIPEKASFVSLSGGKNSIPEWMATGEIVYVELNSDSPVELVFRAFNEEYPDGFRLLAIQESAVYKIPDLSSFSGIDVRLQVSSGEEHIDTVLNPKISFTLPDYGNPMLTIIDDDGGILYLKDILPLCNEMGVSISTAVTTTRIGSSSKWMTWEDIKTCHAMGAEVLCHTYSHPTPNDLLLLSDLEIRERLTTARDKLLDEGIETGDILVYSSSTGYEIRMLNAARSVFKAGIIIGGNTINSKDSDPYRLKRYRIDFASGDGDKSREDYDLEDIKRYIDTVSVCGGWEIMMFHTSNTKWCQLVEVDTDGQPVYDENNEVIPLYDQEGKPLTDSDGSEYERTVGHLVYVPMLKEAIEYARSKGVEIVSAKDGYEAYFQH